MMRAGVEIKAIISYYDGAKNPSYKANIVEIGFNWFIENPNTPPLSVSQVVNATSFPRDDNEYNSPLHN